MSVNVSAVNRQVKRPSTVYQIPMFKRFFLSDRNMMLAILINTIIIFAMYFPELRENDLLHQIDHFFVAFFLIEALVKIIVLKPKGYFSNNWNRFDFIIVLLSLPSLLMAFLPIPDTSSILLLRVFRLARLFRLMRFVPNINMILSGLGRALKASVFVLIVLLLFNLFIAILGCHFYQEIAPNYFGNPLKATYTVFQLFTIEGWNEVADAIAASTHNEWQVGLSKFFFMVVVLVGGIFGMSLANAVFVDEMTMDNNKVLEDKIDNLESEIVKLRAFLEEQNNERNLPNI